jgi:hypothetical protein
MAKESFPYSTTASIVFVPQNEPLGALTARIIESSNIVLSYDKLWHESMKATVPDYQPTIDAAQLADPLASLVATDIAVAFETFLRDLDLGLAHALNSQFHWPRPTHPINSGKPFGFYYYNLPKVRNHFQRIFGIDPFYGTPFSQLQDVVLFRHIHAHRNGFPAKGDASRFRHYRIQQRRRLLLAADALRPLYMGVINSATIINNRLACVALNSWLRSRATLAWSKNSSAFMRICSSFSYFGSLERQPLHIQGYYQALVKEVFPSRADSTKLNRSALSPQKPWRRTKLSQFAA